MNMDNNTLRLISRFPLTIVVVSVFGYLLWTFQAQASDERMRANESIRMLSTAMTLLSQQIKGQTDFMHSWHRDALEQYRKLNACAEAAASNMQQQR